MTMEMLRHSSRRTSAIFEKLRLVLAVVGLQLSKYFCMPSTKSAVPMQLPSRLFCRLLTCNVRQGRIQKFQLRFWSNNPPPLLLLSPLFLLFPSFPLFLPSLFFFSPLPSYPLISGPFPLPYLQLILANLCQWYLSGYPRPHIYGSWRCTLSEDLDIVSVFLSKWRLQPSVPKTLSCVFHLYSASASQGISAQLNGQHVRHEPNPICLGVTLD